MPRLARVFDACRGNMGELYFAHSLSVTKLVSAESTERILVELK